MKHSALIKIKFRLNQICDIFDLKNLIKAATCVMKNCKPSFVDVLLTSRLQFCFGALNFVYSSDWHNMIGVAISVYVCRGEGVIRAGRGRRRLQAELKSEKKKYRCFKGFDQTLLILALVRYSQTCVKQAPMGKPKTGCLRQVIA